MNFRNGQGRVHLAAVVGALCAVGCGILLHEFAFGKGLILSSYDLLQVWRGDRPVSDAVMVYLDEISHLRLKQPQNAAWNRSLHAQLVDRLTAAGARAIVFDIVFSDPNGNDPAGDERLATAIQKSGRTILAAENVPMGPKIKQMTPPFPLLLQSAAGVTWPFASTRPKNNSLR
jgi:CHASE2 domain-containing sensor protein